MGLMLQAKPVIGHQVFNAPIIDFFHDFQCDTVLIVQHPTRPFQSFNRPQRSKVG